MTRRSQRDDAIERLRRRPLRDQRSRRSRNTLVAGSLGLLLGANVAVFGGLVPGVQPTTTLGVDVTGIPLGVDQLIRRGDAADGAGASSGDGQGGGAGAGEAAAGGDAQLDDSDAEPAAPSTPEPPAEPPTDVATSGDEAGGAPTDEPTQPAPSSATDATAPDPDPTPTPSTAVPAGDPAAQALDLVNAERADAGCEPLEVDQRLADSAGAHAADMVVREYFSHDSPDGSTPSSRADEAGYPGQVGENIATGYATAAEVVDGWMASDGHRDNILDCSYTVTGVGHDEGGLPGYGPGTWVQVFGTA